MLRSRLGEGGGSPRNEGQKSKMRPSEEPSQPRICQSAFLGRIPFALRGLKCQGYFNFPSYPNPYPNDCFTTHRNISVTLRCQANPPYRRNWCCRRQASCERRSHTTLAGHDVLTSVVDNRVFQSSPACPGPKALDYRERIAPGLHKKSISFSTSRSSIGTAQALVRCDDIYARVLAPENPFQNSDKTSHKMSKLL